MLSDGAAPKASFCAPSGANHASIGPAGKGSPLRHRSQRHVRYAHLAPRRQLAVCRARPAPARGSNRVRKLVEASLVHVKNLLGLSISIHPSLCHHCVCHAQITLRSARLATSTLLSSGSPVIGEVLCHASHCVIASRS